MPRRPRALVPDGIYHVTSRGNRRQPVFMDEGDRHVFLDLFAEVSSRRRWRCHAYCLMATHYHLVVQTPAADLSAGMQRLNGEYAQFFNHKHEFEGHLFQARFYSVAVESDRHLIELSRYLALNPVRAGLCSAPGDWRWGSYRVLARALPSPSYLAPDATLELFGQDVRRARRAFVAYVNRGAPVGL